MTRLHTASHTEIGTRAHLAVSVAVTPCVVGSGQRRTQHIESVGKGVQRVELSNLATASYQDHHERGTDWDGACRQQTNDIMTKEISDRLS
jgi:hypothetical protein